LALDNNQSLTNVHTTNIIISLFIKINIFFSTIVSFRSYIYRRHNLALTGKLLGFTFPIRFHSCFECVGWFNEWLSFQANWAICQLFHGENKLHFEEMIIYLLCTRPSCLFRFPWC